MDSCNRHIITIGSLVVSAKQTINQTKTASANLILELLKPWRQENFQQFIDVISNTEVTQYDEIKLEKYLNQLEDIAIFWKDKTLTDHIKEFFGVNIKAIGNDKFIQDYMKKWNNKNPNYYFVNLKALIEKVKEWKI